MNCYVNGEFWIERGEYGYKHGLAWALWGPNQDPNILGKVRLLETCRTLNGAKRVALAYGCPFDSWARERVKTELEEKEPHPPVDNDGRDLPWFAARGAL